MLREGLEQIHFDIVFDKFSSQSNVQVVSAIQELLPYLKIRFPLLEQLIIISDNASCFASHDAIPFIYHLNKDMKEKGIRIARWIFTEACTGKRNRKLRAFPQ
jgi:hypothetical protein